MFLTFEEAAEYYNCSVADVVEAVNERLRKDTPVASAAPESPPTGWEKVKSNEAPARLEPPGSDTKE